MTLPSKHSRCPKCHHRMDYKKRSGGQRPHRCPDTPAHRGSGKSSATSVKVVRAGGRRE